MRRILFLFYFVYLFFPFLQVLPHLRSALVYLMIWTKGNLHVEAIHPSFNLEKSYVRLMNVYVNGAAKFPL